MIETAASYSDEIVIHFGGEIEPGAPDESDCPGYDAFVDSLWVEDVMFMGRSIFEGLDPKDPIVGRIKANMAMSLYKDLEKALMYEYERGLE